MFFALLIQAVAAGVAVGFGVYNLENGRSAWFPFAAAAFVLVLVIYTAIIAPQDNG